MSRRLIIILTTVLSLALGYLSGSLFYRRKYDQVIVEMGAKKHLLWELGRKGDLLGKMKAGKYKEAFEIDRELKAKQQLFEKELDRRLAKMKLAAWGVAGIVSLLSLLLGILLGRMLGT
jgi:hypothetical protein